MIIFRENYLRSLLTTGNPEQEDIYKRLKEYDISFEYNAFYVITFDIINLYELSKKNLNSNVVKYAIEELLYFNLEKSGFSGEKVSINDEKISLVINFHQQPQADKSPVYDFVKNIKLDIDNYRDLNLVIGISGSGSSISDLNKLYRQSNKALKYRPLGKQNAIIYFNEINEDGIVFEQDNSDIEDKLNGYITVGDYDKAEKLLAQLFSKLKENESMIEEVFQCNVLHLMSILMTISKRLNIDIYKDFGDDTGIFEVLSKEIL